MDGSDSLKYGILKILNSLVKPKYSEISEFIIVKLDFWESDFVSLPRELHLDLMVMVDGTDYEQEHKIDNDIISSLKYVGLRPHQLHINYLTI